MLFRKCICQMAFERDVVSERPLFLLRASARSSHARSALCGSARTRARSCVPSQIS